MNIIIALEKCQWRNDIDRIEIINDKQFIGYTKVGIATSFTIADTEPYK